MSAINSADQKVRDEASLIEAMERLDIHDHLCLIYDSREEQLAAVIPFIRMGLERGEQCVYIVDENTSETVTTAIREAGIDVNSAVTSGALVILTKQEAYLKKGYFDPEWMINFLKESTDKAKQAGFNALRVTGEMTWVLGGEQGVERLIEYEAKLNYFIPRNDCLALCQYNSRRFPPQIIIDIIRTHPTIIYGTTVCRNFYYVPPDEFLMKPDHRGTVEADRLLRSLVDRERLEMVLRDKEQRFRTTIEGSNAGYFLIDAQGRFQQVNRAWLDMHGYDNEREVTGRHFAITQVNGDLEQAQQYVDRLLSGETIPSGEFSRRCRDGSVGWHSFSANPVLRGGKVVGIEGFLIDITKRKKMEQLLRENEALFHNLFSQSPIAIEYYDSEGRLMDVNAACLELFGVGSLEDVKGFNLFHDPNLTEDTRKRLKSGVAVQFESEYDFDLVRNQKLYPTSRSGVCQVDCLITPLSSNGDRFSGYLVYVRDITERQRSIEALRESEERFRTQFDNLPLPTYIWRSTDDDFILTGYNNAAETVTGGLIEKFLGSRAMVFYADNPDIVADLKHCFSEKKPIRRELDYIFASDELKERGVRKMDTTYSFVPPDLVMIYVDDITERIRAEDALWRRERDLRESQQVAEIGSWDWDKETDAITWSDEYYRIYGIDPELPTPNYREHLKIYTRESGELLDAAVEKAVQTGEPYELDLELADPDAMTRWISARGEAKRDAGGQIVGLRGTAQNITVHKQAEEALQASEEKYRTLFEESKDTIFISSPEGHIFDTNAAGLELLGYESLEDLQKIDVARDLYANPADRDSFQRALSMRGFVRNFELELKTRDGEPVVGAVTANVIRDKAGKIVAVRGIFRDLTRHRQLEQQLIHAQKMESIGQLAGGVAHDFNNFLTAIQGYIDLATMELPADSPAAAELREARASANRAAGLARQLLMFGRREPIDLKPVNLNSIVSDVPKLVGRLIGEQYQIRTESEPGLKTVNADESLIEQVLMNLAVNARDAMPDGGEIFIATHNVVVDESSFKNAPGTGPHELVCLSISDSGGGMDEKTLAHIFEPFFTTKAKGKGTGLGLSVVYGIVTQHEGWIDVESAPGQGCTFKIYLPAIEAAAIDRGDSKSVVEKLRGHGEKVLLVEDDATIRQLAVKMLSDNGYQVESAVDAETAMDIFEQERGNFNLVFSDIVLPGMDGVKLVESLLQRQPRIGVLLASGYSDESSLATIRRRGFCFVQKPYDLRELLQVIRNQLEQR
jgi:PAS domain S-box-containing protein